MAGICLSHLEGRDTMRIYVETDGIRVWADLSEEVAHKAKNRIGFWPMVKIEKLGVLPGNEKKTKRVMDERCG